MRVAFSLLCAAAISTSLSAQTAGSIGGEVRDPSGRPVQGAPVILIQKATGFRRDSVTDGTGRFQAPQLPLGGFMVEISAKGFKHSVFGPVTVSAGHATELRLALELGQLSEAIEVRSEASLISQSASDWGGTISRAKLDSLPLNGRDLFDLAAQQPGVNSVSNASRSGLTQGLGSKLSVNGGRPIQNGFRLDGIQANDAVAGAPSSAASRLLGLEAIEELALVTSPFSAEYGRAAASVLTAVSRSGTNQWRGSLYEYLRNNAVDARNFFDAANQAQPAFRRNQFGGMFGGPLRRNRLFFLSNYEAIRQRQAVTTTLVTPDSAAREGRLPGSAPLTVSPAVRPYLALYPLPNGRSFADGTGEFISPVSTATREDQFSQKVDWVRSERWRHSLRYTFDDATSGGLDAFKVWDFQFRSRYHLLNTETQFLQSPAAIHTFRAAFSRIGNGDYSSVDPQLSRDLTFVPGQPLGPIQVTGLAFLGGTRARLTPLSLTTNDYQLGYQGSWLAGRHSIRAGAGYARLQFNMVSDTNAMGFYVFDSLALFLQARPRSVDVALPGSSSARGFRQHQGHAFLQDEIRFRPGLSVSLGVRYEPYSSPVEVANRLVVLATPIETAELRYGGPLFRNPSRGNFAPRTSLAWNPRGSAATVVRAGFGLFFDSVGTNTFAANRGLGPPVYTRVSPLNPPFPNALAAVAGQRPLPALDTVDYGVEQPYVLQYQAQIQHQFRSRTVARIGYAGTRGAHLTGLLGGANPARPDRLADGSLFFPQGAPRMNASLDRVSMVRTQFNLFYHALQASLERQLTSGLRVQARYDSARTIDEISTVNFRDFLNADFLPNVFDYRSNRGLSDYHVAHTASGNANWRVPVRGGIDVNSVVTWQSGRAFNPRTGFDRARLLASGTFGDLGQRPDAAGIPAGNIVLGGPDRYFDPSAFRLPAAGVLGNLGRNGLIGPGLFTLDAAVQRTLWARERASIRLRAEAFNLTNRPNFQLPSGLNLFDSSGRSVGSAGRITETSTPSRQLQFALRFEF